MKPQQRYYDVLEAFGEPGCAVCRVLQITTERFIMYLLADRVMDAASLGGVRARRGLCSHHISDLVKRRGIVLPLAIFYQAAMNEIVQVMESLPTTSEAYRGWWSKPPISGTALADQIEATQPCLICADMMEQEDRTLEILCKYLTHSQMREAYEASTGLCLPHLLALLRKTPSTTIIALVTTTQRRLWKQGAAELDEFIAKLNYARRDEAKGHEGGSLMRAVEWTAGLQGVFGLDFPKRK